MIVAEIDGGIVGFAAIIGGELDGLFVEPKLWRRGIGRTLIDAATQAARDRGLAVTVTANPTAREFTSAAALLPKARRRPGSDRDYGCHASSSHTSSAGACPR